MITKLLKTENIVKKEPSGHRDQVSDLVLGYPELLGTVKVGPHTLLQPLSRNWVGHYRSLSAFFHGLPSSYKAYV